MNTFYTRTGDDGYTGLLGEGRVPKDSARPEALGTVDEATAALGWARAHCRAAGSAELLLAVQRDLYRLMSEVAATPANAQRFRSIDAERVSWLEQQTDQISRQVHLPEDFIVPGDTIAGAALAMARTIIRRAERRMAGLLHSGEIENRELLRYLNRLSSLCFVLELYETQFQGIASPTLVKPETP